LPGEKNGLQELHPALGPVVNIVQVGLGALRRGARSFATRSWVDAWRSSLVPGHPPVMPHAAWKKAGLNHQNHPEKFMRG